MKKLLNIIGFPLLFVVSQFFMTIIVTIIFIITRNHPDLNNWIGSENYTIELSEYLSKYGIIGLLILCCIFLPILYKKYHKEVKETKSKIPMNQIMYFITLGFSFSFIYNSILGSINHMIPITNLFDGKIYISSIIGTTLIGPILEEYLFRGITYHRLQKYYPVMKSLLLTGLIFALFHQNIVQMIYAFIFNFILIFAYEKYQLKASILVHMSANLGSILFSAFFYSNPIMIELLLFLSSLILIISYWKLKIWDTSYLNNR